MARQLFKGEPFRPPMSLIHSKVDVRHPGYPAYVKGVTGSAPCVVRAELGLWEPMSQAKMTATWPSRDLALPLPLEVVSCTLLCRFPFLFIPIYLFRHPWRPANWFHRHDIQLADFLDFIAANAFECTTMSPLLPIHTTFILRRPCNFDSYGMAGNGRSLEVSIFCII